MKKWSKVSVECEFANVKIPVECLQFFTQFFCLFSSARRKGILGFGKSASMCFLFVSTGKLPWIFLFAVSAELTNVSRKYEQLMSDYHDLLTSNDQQKNTQVTEIHWVTPWEEFTAILHYLLIIYFIFNDFI